MLLLRFLFMLLATGLLVFLLAAYLMARGLLRPPRMSDGKASYLLRRLSPADLGLGFTPITFNIRDQQTNQPLILTSWWIPHTAPSDKSVILLHGYADAKVGALAWAPPFHELGYNILALDLRAHGESAGRISSGGYWERHDVEQVVNDLKARYPTETKHLILFGASLGAAIAVALAAERSDIDAVVMESPYTDFRRAAAGHFNLVGIGLTPLQKTALYFAQQLSKADLSVANPLALIPKSHSPILIIQGAEDPLTNPDEQLQLKEAIKNRDDGSLYWKLENVPHLMAIAAAPDEYRQKLADFLQIANRQSQFAASLTTPSTHPTQ
jgi:pimeloyl-ACP methyl ester carboxylesterase